MEFLNLDQFKASGIYTIEIDASQSLVIPLTTGRLLIGSSRRGPANTVVLVNEPKVARNVYGPRDYFLENRGSYFHKDLSVMLNEGPVYAMNVIPMDLNEDNYDGNHYANMDRGAFIPVNLESASYNDNELLNDFKPAAIGSSAHTAPLKNYFNRQKFWYASDTELTKVKNKSLAADLTAVNEIMSIANLGKRQITIFLQKASLQGYDLTVKEWYAGFTDDNSKPAFVHDDDFISDFMVDVIVVEGDWTNYQRLAADPIYSAYFNERGLIVGQADNFLQVGDITVINRTMGCLIPDFQDRAGRNISIDMAFNSKYPLTELLMSIDFDRLERYDLSTDSFTSTDASSYRLDYVGHGIKDLMECEASSPDDSFALFAAAPSTYPIKNVMIDTMSYRRPIYSQYSFVYETGSPVALSNSIVVDTDPGTPVVNKLVAYEDSKLYKLWKSGHIVSGDYNPVFGGSPASKVYIKISGPFDSLIGIVSTKYITIEGYSDKQLTYLDSLSLDESNTAITFVSTQGSAADAPVDPYLKTFTSADMGIQKTDSNKLRLTISQSNPAAQTEIFKYVRPGYYIMAKVDGCRARMLKILSVSKVTQTGTPLPGVSLYDVITMHPNSDTVEGIDAGSAGAPSITVYKGVYNYVSSIHGFKIQEYALRAQLLPDGTAQRQSDIYKYIFDSGLNKAITSGEPLDVRHMVDSYEGEISESAKFWLIKLGAQHAKTLVFANSPSMKQFEQFTDPTFVDPYTGLLNAQYIAEGGNFTMTPPSFAYKLASGIEKGVPIESFAIYAMPNLIIREGNKNKSIPPAAYVSNAYIRKFSTGNTYGIVAARKGVLTESEIVGVEYDLSDDDRAWLEPAGYNLIIRRRGIGTMLFTNNTAYQKVQSALNNAHVRDTLITIEKDVERILFNFLFDFNDGITQIRVKTLVENYLDNVMAARGLSWYDVIMDATNNTDEVMEQNVGIIDIMVDFPRGIQKFINRVTITRKGGKLSATQSGFGIAG